MFNINFTTKVVLMISLPLLFFILVLYFLQSSYFNKLLAVTSVTSKEQFLNNYKAELQLRGQDTARGVRLQMDVVRNELEILTAYAQELIDTNNDTSATATSSESEALVNSKLKYDAEAGWSNTFEGELDTAIGVWGYLHTPQGEVQQNTIDYIASMFDIIPWLKHTANNGAEKGWVWMTGPKETPVTFLSPWVDLPRVFAETYPDIVIDSWWDNFFPGVIEGWELWLKNNANRPHPRDEITLTPLYEDAAGDGLMVSFMSPLWNQGRSESFGAIGIDYKINNLIALVSDEAIGETGFSFLVQSDGNVLGLQDTWKKALGLDIEVKQSEVGVNIYETNLANSQYPELLKISAGAAQSGFRIETISGQDQQLYLVAFQKVHEFNRWTGNGDELIRDSLHVGMIVPMNEVLKTHFTIQRIIIDAFTGAKQQVFWLGLIFLLISLVIAIYFSIKQTRQINLMSRCVDAVKAKNFNAKIPIVIAGELGDLAHTFNQMTTEIQDGYSRLEEYATTLEEQVKDRTLHLEEANKKLAELSDVDGLTHIKNRRYLDRELPLRWQNNRRTASPLSIIMIDIDEFKRYNDHYGHQAGDACLCDVAKTLENTLKRSSDALMRYGGEEFCVALDCDLVKAKSVAEQLRVAIASLAIEHENSKKGIVSISLGVSSVIPPRSEEITAIEPYLALIKAADDALYTSKENGRDQVT